MEQSTPLQGNFGQCRKPEGLREYRHSGFLFIMKIHQSFEASTGKWMYLISHYPLQSTKHQIAGAMACVELSVRIVGFQPVSKGKQFLFGLMSVK